jgi:hypothetical protein
MLIAHWHQRMQSKLSAWLDYYIPLRAHHQIQIHLLSLASVDIQAALLPRRLHLRHHRLSEHGLEQLLP